VKPENGDIHLCIWQTLLSKETYVAFQDKHFYQFLLTLAGNQTHDLGIASANTLATGDCLTLM